MQVCYKKILSRTKCCKCIKYLKAGNTLHPAAELVTLKSRGNLIYPNTYLFQFLSKVETSFSEHCMDFDVFNKVIEDITRKQLGFKYTCDKHRLDVTTDILVYYLQMRLCQYSYQTNLKLQKILREKKVLKIYNT